MRVARNCLKRRSLMLRISSPTSLMLPPDGTSEPFCNSPITVSEVTDLPEPLSPTRHSVSASRTCSETPSMMRSLRGSLPRPTTRLSISRTTCVISANSRHCEERSDEAIQSCLGRGRSGLLRGACHRAALCADPLARNDGLSRRYFFAFRFFAVLRFFAAFFGTFAPAARASERPIATACLRLLTFLPDRPLFNVPALRFFIARPTLAEAFFEYLRAMIILPVARK